MSEWQAHVYCTCFRDGAVQDLPHPRSALTVNRFGVVTLVDSTDHASDPDDLWTWRMRFAEDEQGGQPPCAHDQM